MRLAELLGPPPHIILVKAKRQEWINHAAREEATEAWKNLVMNSVEIMSWFTGISSVIRLCRWSS